MTLEQRVQQRMRGWASRRTSLLCAVSGGVDSVVLAHLLKSLSYPLILAHVDHQIRKNSARDAQFVRALARRWHLPFQLQRVNVPAYAAKHSLGLEEAARDCRYTALARMARRARCSVIVTAHTADDQAETMLMNFLRGAGPGGLSGMPSVRPLTHGVELRRPLLNVPRTDLFVYARTHGVSFREDPSNASQRFARNRIRHRVFPLLEKEYPGLKGRLVQMADIFREEQRLWVPQMQREFNKTVRQNNKKITIDLTRLLGYHKALGRRILRHLLTGISFQDTERVFQLARSPNKHLSFQFSGGLQVERKGNELIIHTRGFHE